MKQSEFSHSLFSRCELLENTCSPIKYWCCCRLTLILTVRIVNSRHLCARFIQVSKQCIVDNRTNRYCNKRCVYLFPRNSEIHFSKKVSESKLNFLFHFIVSTFSLRRILIFVINFREICDQSVNFHLRCVLMEFFIRN